MREDDALRADIERPAEQPPQITLDMAGPASRQQFVGEIAPILRDECRVQAFGGGLRDDAAQIVAKAGIADRDLCPRDLLAQPSLEQGASGDDRPDQIIVAAERGGELLGCGVERAPETSKVRNQSDGGVVRAVAGEGLEEMRHDRYGPRRRVRTACRQMPPARIRSRA